VAGGVSSAALGDTATALGDYSTALGAYAFATGVGSTAIGYNSVADRDNTVSVGSAGNERQITNVAAGTQDTDAVNVGQLNNVLVAAGANAAAQLDTVAAAFGGGASIDVNGMLAPPMYSIQGSSYFDVGSAFSAIDGSLSSLSAQIAAIQDAPSFPGDGKGVSVGHGSHAKDSTDIAIGPGAVVGADSGTAVGSNATIAAVATNAVAIGANTSVTAAGGTAVGEGATVTASGATAIGQNSVADQANTVSVGSAGNERRVTNVAAGTGATDAANVGQMQAGDTATLSSARGYTDQRFQALNDQFSDLSDQLGARLDHQDSRIDKEGAMNAAMMNMAINAANSRSPRGRIGAGIGWQGGEAAMSVGYSKQVGEHASFSLGGAFSGSEQSVGAGFGIDL